jgi:hypothetical protein
MVWLEGVPVLDGGVMRLDVTALALAAGLMWGAAMLVVASANLVWPTYGEAFLALVASISEQSAAACSTGSTTSSRAGARAARRNQRISAPSR